MNGPKRLSERGSSKARALLLAGRRDVPPSSLVPSVLGALGMAATAALIPSWGAKLAGVLKHLLSLKFLGVGVVAIAATGGYVAGRMHERALRANVVSPAVEARATASYVSARKDPVAPGARSTTPGPLGRLDVANPSPPPAVLPADLPAPPAATTSSTASAASTASPAGGAVEQGPMGGQHIQRAAAASSGARSSGGASSASQGAPASADASAAASASAGPSAASSLEASLADELGSIKRARAGVMAGKGREALDELGAYARAHPHGTFEEEALALRVRASRLVSDQAGAATALAELKARFPHSVQLAGLETSATSH